MAESIEGTLETSGAAGGGGGGVEGSTVVWLLGCRWQKMLQFACNDKCIFAKKYTELVLINITYTYPSPPWFNKKQLSVTWPARP